MGVPMRFDREEVGGLDQNISVTKSKNFSTNPTMLYASQVIFEFAHKIDDELAAELEEIGVKISYASLHSNKIVADEQDDEISNLENINKIGVLNLDVTTMLAYVSALTNGSNFEFTDKILAQQSALERSVPVKAMLDKIFEGKKVTVRPTEIGKCKTKIFFVRQERS